MTHPNPVAERTDRSLVALAVAFIACFSAAGIGSIAVSQTLQSWYTGLQKPAWNPPNWVFGPVWTMLYAAMAISGWLVWRGRHFAPAAARTALSWFALQLALNTAWSFFFFAWRRPDWAFAEIVVLWIAIVMTMLTSWRVSRIASLLLAPYLLWVTFASTLNAVIWWLNS